MILLMNFLDFHIPKDSYVDQWDISGLESDIKNHLAAISALRSFADKDGFESRSIQRAPSSHSLANQRFRESGRTL